jgi:acetylornithine deacetylase/succinyl-diaminopimelate desuccinylase-like protein
MFSPGYLLDPDHPMVRAAAAAVGRRNGGSGPAEVRPWTFATDGGWTCGVHGIPTIGFAPGEERYAHTNRERLEVEEARWSLDRYPALVLAMQEALAG